MARPLVSRLSVFAVLACLAWPTNAVAVPIEGRAQAEAGSGGQAGARARAIREARVAALEAALDSLEIPVDPTALDDVRARAEAWTTAYRVLELGEGDGTVEVRVEVDIDLPRLRKRVAQRDSQDRARGFGFGQLRVEGCSAIEEAMVVDPLRSYGIVTDATESTLSLELRCFDRGVVEHTYVRAVGVELDARVEGESSLSLSLSTEGFAETAELSARIGLDRAVAELADALAIAARGELELRVERPWPASRVTELERRLRDEVLGVDQVELAGIGADGTAILRIAGSLDAKQLGRALEDASFSSFSLVGLRVDGAHALRVRMQ